MQIDWFTFVAQIFNFVLLVYLLKRFLYKPVLNAIRDREERVRGRLEEARVKEEAAEEERARYEKLEQELELRRTNVLRAAEEDAERRRQELTTRVRDEVRTIRKEWRESLSRQKESFLEELRRKMSRELYSLVERVLADLANTAIEDRLIEVFLERLRTSESGDRDEFVTAAQNAGGRIELRTSFPLTEEQRRRLEVAIDEWAGTGTGLSWEEDPGLALGIELLAGDRKIAWSADDYLDVLESETSRLLEAEIR